MKKSRAGFWAGIAVFVIAAVYSAVVFLAKANWDISAWILYGFTMVAFLLAAVQFITASRSGSGLVLDAALGVVTLVYLGLQFILGGIVCMSLSNLPATPVVIFECILLAAYLVIAFKVYGAQSHSAAQDYNDRKAVQKVRLWESDILGMADQTADSELRQALKKLAEEIHYSDVASLPGLADVENKIGENIAALREDLAQEESDPLARVKTIHRLVNERNRTAAMRK